MSFVYPIHATNDNINTGSVAVASLDSRSRIFVTVNVCALFDLERLENRVYNLGRRSVVEPGFTQLKR